MEPTKPYTLASAYNRASRKSGPKLVVPKIIEVPVVVLRVWSSRRADRRTRSQQNGWIEYACNLGSGRASVWEFFLVEGIPSDACLLLKDDSDTEIDARTGLEVYPVRRISWKDVDYSIFQGEPLSRPGMDNLLAN